MQQDNPMFWDTIRKYEERLAQNPDAFIFARLAEAYLKVGMVDEALECSRNGVSRHPAYIAGQRALAMACDATGNLEECLQALELVSTAIPEDMAVQKLFGRLLISQGKIEQARAVFLTALEFNPYDAECLDELDALDRHADASSPHDSVSRAGDADSDLDEEIIDDLEILEIDEDNILDDEDEEMIEAPAEAAAAPATGQDPLSTATLAELYVQQGHIDKALKIFRALLAEEPDNDRIRSRIAELDLPEDMATLPAGAGTEEALSPGSFDAASPEARTEADRVAATLEGMLDNIERIRACR